MKGLRFGNLISSHDVDYFTTSRFEVSINKKLFYMERNDIVWPNRNYIVIEQ